MTRVPTLDPAATSGETRQMLDEVRSALGLVPNFIRVLANSPAALRAFLGFNAISGSGVLDPRTRERIALAVSEQNACTYCVSAHTALGRGAGLEEQEMQANRRGRSSDARAEAALTFARALMLHNGQVSKAEFDAVRAAGHSDAEIVEILAHVALTSFTNMLGRATQVEIDFPVVELQRKAS